MLSGIIPQGYLGVKAVRKLSRLARLEYVLQGSLLSTDKQIRKTPDVSA